MKNKGINLIRIRIKRNKKSHSSKVKKQVSEKNDEIIKKEIN